ncbi:MAG: Rrf2 family transcriptional regulator [Bdellovibrionales bacterium]
MNRKLEYALMALKHMSLKVPGQLTTAKEVVSVTGVPFDATARVLQQMAQQGLLRAEHGAHGGYSIVKDLSKISLFELQEMILGPLELVKCLQGEPECELVDRCNIQSPLAALNRRLSEFYRSVTLAELLKIKEGKRVSEAVVETQFL